jgi:hypothetical protein
VTSFGIRSKRRFSAALSRSSTAPRFSPLQHDPIKHIQEYHVELASALAEPDRQKPGQRILRRLHLFNRSAPTRPR